MRPRTRNKEHRHGFEVPPPIGGQLAGPTRAATTRSVFDVLRAMGLRIVLFVEAWLERRLDGAGQGVEEGSPLADRIQFAERLTAILLMISSAGTAVLTYYGVSGPLTEAGATAIQKGQAVTQAPVVFTAASVSADEARQFGVTPEALADLAHRLCRFGN